MPAPLDQPWYHPTSHSLGIKCCFLWICTVPVVQRKWLPPISGIMIMMAPHIYQITCRHIAKDSQLHVYKYCFTTWTITFCPSTRISVKRTIGLLALYLSPSLVLNWMPWHNSVLQTFDKYAMRPLTKYN